MSLLEKISVYSIAAGVAVAGFFLLFKPYIDNSDFNKEYNKALIEYADTK